MKASLKSKSAKTLRWIVVCTTVVVTAILLIIRSSEISKTMVLQRKANDIDMGLDEIDLLNSIFEHRISRDTELLANRSREYLMERLVKLNPGPFDLSRKDLIDGPELFVLLFIGLPGSDHSTSTSPAVIGDFGPVFTNSFDSAGFRLSDRDGDGLAEYRSRVDRLLSVSEDLHVVME